MTQLGDRLAASSVHRGNDPNDRRRVLVAGRDAAHPVFAIHDVLVRLAFVIFDVLVRVAGTTDKQFALPGD